jgi:hypothetical protein
MICVSCTASTCKFLLVDFPKKEIEMPVIVEPVEMFSLGTAAKSI